MTQPTSVAASHMTKRALIVDDSRSARVILGRMLEGYGLAVDSAESAEQALEYLKQTRPDVIFMDHLMPGMDGFQAVQVIKGNPQTATIPVVMYTSQEGELYASQARALGAVGVLPKTVKQVDVSRMLYQLRLLAERREDREARTTLNRSAIRSDESMDDVTIDTPAATVGEIEQAIRTAMASPLKEQSAELRRFVLASLEAFARRIGTEIKQTTPATESVERVAGTAPAEPAPASSPRWPLVALIVAVALLPTIVLAALYTRTLQSTQDLMRSNARLAAIVEEQHAQIVNLQQKPETLASSGSAATSQAADHSKTQTELVPYGDVPLSGARSDKLRELVTRLKSESFHGRLRIATFTGNFCLTGNGIEGYSLAADELPAKRCDQIGNPFDDGLATPQRQSLAFANQIASARRDKDAAFTIEVVHEGHQPAIAEPDPEVASKMTARELNRIAAQNNRVEFSIDAAP
jgi:CheY-like chemotaxis protein